MSKARGRSRNTRRQRDALATERAAIYDAVVDQTPDTYRVHIPERVLYFDIQRAEQERPGKPRKVSYLAYLKPSWNYDGEQGEHMITLTYDDRSATIQDITRALHRVRRCYCATCLGFEFEDLSGEVTDEHLAMRVRRTIAEANGIQIDGLPSNEAKLEAILNATQETNHAE